MDAALELVGAGPAARALLLVGSRRPRAGNAADRAVADVVRRVVGNLVDGDVGPDAFLVPVCERVHLPDAVALGPLHLRRLRTARRLAAADAGDPGAVRREGVEQRLDLADVAAAVRIALPEVRSLLLVLLGDREHMWRDQVEPVALDERVARLVRLAEEELRVELDHRNVERELADHVHEHRRLLLPRARETELVAELAVRPAENVLRRHRFDVRKAQARRRQAGPPSVCRRAGRAAASRAG